MYFDLRPQHVGGASAMSCLVSLALFLVVGSIVGVGQSVKEQHSSHTNNWAVLVCSSRYWFNYRHVANTLSIYRSVKRLGIPDSNIILMLADDMACNARNPRPATVFNNANEHINVYGDDIEVDYRGYEVTVENFLRVLTGRLDSSTPRSKRLLSDDRSNILIYMTGHGGDGFLKFQDAEEISSAELADAFEQMWQKRRYNELMFTIETCQAASMIHKFYSPNIVASGSSRVGEDALSHHMDSAIGVHIIDRWTYYALEFLEKVTSGSKATLKDFFGYFDPDKVKSHPEVRTDLFKRELTKVLVTDFFGSVRNTEMLNMTTQQDTVTFLHHLQSLQEMNNVCDSEEEDTCHQSSPSPSPPPLPPAHQLQPSDHLNISIEAGSPLSVSFPSLTHQFLGMTILVAMTTVASIGLYVLVSAPSVR